MALAHYKTSKEDVQMNRYQRLAFFVTALIFSVSVGLGVEALEIESGVPVTGSLSASDLFHYYLFPVPADSILDVTLTATNVTDTAERVRVGLHSGWGPSSDIELYYADAGPDQTVTIYVQSLVRNTYYISVFGIAHYGFNTADYELTATLTLSAPVDDAGDTIDTALPLRGSNFLTQTLETATDEDFYSFYTGDTGRFTLDIYDISGGNVDVEVQNSYGTVLYSSTNPGEANEQILVNFMPPGLYFLRVFSPENAIASYSIQAHLLLDSQSPLVDTIGNDRTTALQIPPGLEITSQCSTGSEDNDYFLIVQSQTGPMEIVLDNLHLADSAREGIDVYLQNMDGMTFARSEFSSTTADRISLASLAAGIYYIRVRPRLDYGFNGGQYTLRYVPAAMPAEIGDDSSSAAIYNGYKTEAANPTGRPFVGQLDHVGDQDLYRLWLADNGNITLQVDQMYSCNANLELLDNALAVLVSSANPSQDPESISVVGLPKGTYYARVTDAGGTVGQYRFVPTFENNELSEISDDYGNRIDLAFPPTNHLYATASLHNGDLDYFSFHVDRISLVMVSVYDIRLGDPLRESVELALRDASDNTLASGTNSSDNPEFIPAVLAPGDYYARIYPRADYGYDGAFYTIKIDIGSRIGDVSGNGEVTPYDASLVRQHLNGTTTLTDEQLGVADVDGDADVDLADANLILDYSVGNITSFPAEP